MIAGIDVFSIDAMTKDSFTITANLEERNGIPLCIRSMCTAPLLEVGLEASPICLLPVRLIQAILVAIVGFVITVITTA